MRDKKHPCPDFPHFLHGADYNPEQWMETKEIWDEDMALMKKANCNEMTVGIFSWSTIEPREGEYDFSFLDEIIGKISANGGKVILSTPSGARPRWLAEKYPEDILTMRRNGMKTDFSWNRTAELYRKMYEDAHK